MADTTNRIQYILEAAQAQAQAKALDASLDGIGKSAKSGAAQATAALNATTASTRGAAVAGREAELIYQNVVRTQGAGSKAALDLAAALGITTTATQASTVATEANAVAHVAAESGTTKAAEGFSRLTTRINVGRGALQGYDAAIEGVVRAFGGIQLGFAVAIGLAAALLPKIISLITAKGEQIKLDKEQISNDLLIQKGSERNVRVAADMTAAFRILRAEKESYSKTTKELTDRLHLLETQGFATVTSVSQGGQTYQRVSRSAADLAHEVSGLNAEIGKQEEVLAPALETIRRHQEATHETTEATVQWAFATHKIAAEDIPFMTEQLNRATPALDEFTKKLNDLKVPRFDVAGSLPGLGSLRASVEATFQLARSQGITDWAEQVRFATPALKALDEGLKNYTGTVAGYRKELSALEPGERAAISLMEQQQKTLEEEFKTRQKIKDIGPQLEMESLRAQAKLHEDDLGFRISIIHREFDLRREELRKNEQATADNLTRLEIMENIATVELLQELKKRADATVEHYAKLNEERAKDLTRQREFREKEEREFHLHLVKQRQDREDQERKFFENQAKIERELRADRPGRRTEEADAIRRANVERERAVAIFGKLSREEGLLAKQVALANGQLSDQEAILTALGTAAESFTEDWIKSGAIFQFVADGIAQSLEGMVARGEDFGANMKGVFLDLIAQLAAYFGRLFISIGAGMLFIHPAAGAGLIAAGVALMALSGLFAGLAAKAHESARAQAPAGAGAGGSSSATSGGGAQESHPGQLIPFPTSGATATDREAADRREAIARFGMWGTIPAATEWIRRMRQQQALISQSSGSSGPHTINVNVRLDQAGTRDFLKGQKVMIISDAMSPGSPTAKAIKKAA